ncbi:MAG TPA: amidohydrolase [Bacteroidales bacterium]|nr:amidohydrolase [Bacteroidales bacterium]
MKVSIIQPDTRWEDKVSNFSILDDIISDIKSDTDIIILPEMFSTGFSMNNTELSEPPGGETYDWMISMAEKTNSALCGSYMIRSGLRYLNRWVFVTPEKRSWSYDKRHLFRMGNEHLYFSPGNKRLTFSFRGVRIFPGVCYDLRFPVWSRNINNYDLLINSANWPSPRRNVWLTLLTARALENQCYVAGANRIGKDGTGVTYTGDSVIISPGGKILASAGKNTECSITAEISITELKEFRTKFPVLKDIDKFTITK